MVKRNMYLVPVFVNFTLHSQQALLFGWVNSFVSLASILLKSSLPCSRYLCLIANFAEPGQAGLVCILLIGSSLALSAY